MSENDFREVIDEEPNDTEKSSGTVETAEENKRECRSSSHRREAG